MNVLLIGSRRARTCDSPGNWLNQKHYPHSLSPPGNPGTAQCGQNVALDVEDHNKLLDFAQQNKVELVVVGPEDPLAAGIVDTFEAAGIKAFGPSGKAAQLEADKAFAKQLMRSSSVSTAEARVFDRFSDAKAYIASRDEPVVIKAAGLAKGKGVYVCDDPYGRHPGGGKDHAG